MKKTLVAIAIALMIYLAYCFIYSPTKNDGKLAPDFTASLVDGSDFELSDLRNNYVLLDFWGSWCAPCRRDNPNLVALHNQFHNKSYKDAENFEVVTVALEKNDKQWKKAAEKDGFIWKNQIVKTARYVLTDPIAIKYGVKDVPSKFLIDPKGNIVGVNQSKQEIASYLSEKLRD